MDGGLLEVPFFPFEDFFPGTLVEPVVHCDHGGDVFGVGAIVALAGHGVEHLLWRWVLPDLALGVHRDRGHITRGRERGSTARRIDRLVRQRRHIVPGIQSPAGPRVGMNGTSRCRGSRHGRMVHRTSGLIG